jgi:hypothetical protein
MVVGKFMKKLSICLLTVSAMLASISAYACSGDVEVAESALRIVLNRPANGETIPRSWRTHSKKIEAMKILLHVEQRSPGLLEGK